MKRVLGIDPGFGRMGFGIVEEVGRDKYRSLAHGCLETDKGLDFPDRLIEIEKECKALIKDFKPELLAVEQLFFSKNVTTAMKVSHARGVIVLCGAKEKLPILDLNPLQIKQTITGHGGASKSQMQRMVQMLLGLKELPRPDDAADALGIALCGFLYRG